MLTDRADDQLAHTLVYAFWIAARKQPAVLSVAPRSMAHANEISAWIIAPPLIGDRVFVQLGPGEGFGRIRETPLATKP